MIKFTFENSIVFMTLSLCLVFGLVISGGCKKKEQPEEPRQAVPAEESQQVSTAEEIDEIEVSEQIDLRILYAGLPNTERAKDFVDFFSKHFKQVETTDYNTFTADKTDGFDVSIIDYDGVEFRAPRPNISRQYSRATVTMGVPGAFICSSLSLKIGYL